MKAEGCRSRTASWTSAGAIEVLEHVPDPEHTVAEMARVASRWLLVIVPREPCGAANMAAARTCVTSATRRGT